MFSKISEALRGNKNAAGPRVKKVGTALKSAITPLKRAVKTAGSTVRDNALIGGAVGATYGKALSNNLARSMGMAPARNIALKTAGRYALRAAKGYLPLTALAVGADYYLAQKEAKTVRGRLATAKGKIKAKVKQLKGEK